MLFRSPRAFAPEIWSENVVHLGDPAVRCLSVASFGPRDVFASNLGSGRMSASPFFGYLFWRSKKGNCPRGMSSSWTSFQRTGLERHRHPLPSPLPSRERGLKCASRELRAGCPAPPRMMAGADERACKLRPISLSRAVSKPAESNRSTLDPQANPCTLRRPLCRCSLARAMR